MKLAPYIHVMFRFYVIRLRVWCSRYSLIIMYLLLSACEDPVVKPPLVIVNSAKDILPVEGKWVRPVVYSNEMDFGNLTVEKKKEKFVDMMLPSILMVKHNMKIERARVGDLLWQLESKGALDAADSVYLEGKMAEYNADDVKNLYQRMATHPTSIVLAQAAVESGWGSSRFFTEANNIFGIWSYSSTEDRIQAAHIRESGAVYLRKYPNIAASIEDYFKTLARARPYSKFRKQRVTLEDPFKLIYFLNNYSERKYKYVADLSQMMKINQLTAYDSLALDPSYYREGEKIVY